MAAKKQVRAKARISDDLLDRYGLKELWHNTGFDSGDPLEQGVQAAYLLKEGIYLVTVSPIEGGERLLKFLDRKDGIIKWELKINGPILESPFAYHYTGGTKISELYFRINDTVHCVDLQHGETLWRQTVVAPIDSRVIANDRHFFYGSVNGSFYAVRKNTKIVEWQHKTGGSITASPAISRGRIAFGSNGGGVFGLDASQGFVNLSSWKRDTGARILGGIVPYSRWFFAGSSDYRLYCLEASNGNAYWSFGAENPIQDTPVVYRHKANQEFVFCLANAGSFASPSRTLFAVPLPKGQRTPVGKADWSFEGVSRVVSMGSETVYALSEIGSGSKTLLGLDVKTGEKKFALPLEGFNFAPTNLSDYGRDKGERGKIYLISRNGAIQAIGEK